MFLNWIRDKFGPSQPAVTEPDIPLKRGSLFSTHGADSLTTSAAAQRSATIRQQWNDYMRAHAPRPVTPGGTMDDNDANWNNIKGAFQIGQPSVSDAVFQFFAVQSFIGHQMCAILSQHWMVEKICRTPALDAIRQGYEIVNAPGEERLTDDIIAEYAKYDERFQIVAHMKDYGYFGRIFGIRVAVPIVESIDPDYYEKPFNEDGITPGSFKGWMQIDPYWMAPILNADASGRPDTPHFYEPTWWLINGKRYHRTHLCIFRTQQPADILKPSYLYSGVPIPQKIMERVYAAERTGNEAPLLILTKRLYTLKIADLPAAYANKEQFDETMALQQMMQDNYGIRAIGSDDEMAQFDTALSDLWTTIEGEYALACAAGDAPVNKIMGTAAGGLSNEGAYDESNYHETLESLQTHEFSPFLKRHHLLVRKSYIEPKFGAAGAVRTDVSWAPLDAPTAKEYAEINQLNAQADLALVQTGAISDADINSRLRNDKNSGYSTIREIAEGEHQPTNGGIDDPDADIETGTPGKVTVTENENGNSAS